MNSELEAQWLQDIRSYGSNAYLMWTMQSPLPKTWVSFTKNSQILGLAGKYEVKRKLSAELPFDLKRAEAEDEVESLWSDGSWRTYNLRLVSEDYFIQDGNFQHGNTFIPLAKLRMKYPPKI